ncbi:MAG TPA: TIM barrel protein [Cyclobacteriaceae bacterium]|nr:TIM barrel protein [Cyclobacteriaceae bacterium]
MVKNVMSTWMLFCLMGQFACSSPNDKTADDQTEVDAVGDTRWETGIALYSFNRYSFPETLDMAKRAGVRLVEGFFFHQLGGEFGSKGLADLEQTELGKIKDLLGMRDLEMRSMYAGGETADDWVRMYQIGEELGLEFLVGEPEPEHWDLIDSLGKASGISMAIHEHARGLSRFWHPDSVLIALEGRESFKACGDLGHWVRSGLDPVDCLKKLEGHLLGIHAKDLDEFGAIKANDVKLSTGVIDYKAVVEELNRQDFDGPIYIECEHDWDSNFGDVKYAVDFLNRFKAQDE